MASCKNDPDQKNLHRTIILNVLRLPIVADESEGDPGQADIAVQVGFAASFWHNVPFLTSLS